jgi:hypothetical protein
LLGLKDGFGGSGISYTTQTKSANITVSGSDILFAPDLPLYAIPVGLVLGIETDATNYDVQVFLSSRAIGSTGAFSSFLTFSMPGSSGSINKQWIFNPLSNVRKTTSSFEWQMEINVVLTTPGTFFYLGNPSIAYIG